MLISFTKDAAKLFNVKLNLARSEKNITSSLSDDWVMGVAFSDESATGVYLIHCHSLLTLFVVAVKPDITLCMDLLYSQLLQVLDNYGINVAQYTHIFEIMFVELISFRHDNPAISREIGNLKNYFYWFEENSSKRKQKMHSIDLVVQINNDIRQKFDFQSSLEVFSQLLQNHQHERIVITDNHPEYEKYTSSHHTSTIIDNLNLHKH